MKNIHEMTYREIQTELKEYKKQGLTDIKLNQSYTILETELREIRQGLVESEADTCVDYVENQIKGFEQSLRQDQINSQIAERNYQVITSETATDLLIDDIITMGEIEAASIKMESTPVVIQKTRDILAKPEKRYERLESVRITKDVASKASHNFFYWQRLSAFLNNKKSYKTYSRKA